MLKNKWLVIPFFKVISIVLTTFLNFYQLNLFSKFFDKQTFAFMMVVSGYSYYLSFLDVGISKPLYSTLRKKFLNKDDLLQHLLNTASAFYTLLVIIIILVITVLSLVLDIKFNSSFDYLTLLIIAINISLNICLPYFKNLLYSIDKILEYEQIDLFRRLFNLISLLLLYVDQAYRLSVFIFLIVQLVLFFLVFKKLNFKVADKASFNKKDIKEFIATYWKDSFNYLFFIISESVIYNWGFILVPFMFSQANLIEYGIWNKILMAFVLLNSIISDLFLSKITSTYFANHYKETRVFLYKTIFFSFCLGVALFLFLFNFREQIFKFWVHDQYKLSSMHIFSLGVFFIANSLQHHSGTFLLSVGGYFKNMRIMSLTLSGLTILLLILIMILKYNFEQALMLTSIIYAGGAVWYFIKAQKILA
jgi:O-antigen/teichoic acid export membrane protein